MGQLLGWKRFRPVVAHYEGAVGDQTHLPQLTFQIVSTLGPFQADGRLGGVQGRQGLAQISIPSQMRPRTFSPVRRFWRVLRLGTAPQ